jgi:hypothetical protein
MEHDCSQYLLGPKGIENDQDIQFIFAMLCFLPTERCSVDLCIESNDVHYLRVHIHLRAT